jgi:hypothetical protein
LSASKPKENPAGVKPVAQTEEEIDIDLTDPEVEKAALAIQSKFKGFKKGKVAAASAGLNDIPVVEETTKVGAEGEPARDKTAEIGSETLPTDSAKMESNPKSTPVGKEEEEIDIDLNDPEVEKAALAIQSKFKGFRKGGKGAVPSAKAVPAGGDVKKDAPETKSVEKPCDVAPGEKKPGSAGTENPEEEIDIDLNDPEVEKAALAIQSKFKGMKFGKKSKAVEVQKVKVATEGGGTVACADGVNCGDEAGKGTGTGGGELQKGGGKSCDDIKTGKEKGVESVKCGEEEEVDIDLNDPEVEKAALAIQSKFKGMKFGKKSKAAEASKTKAEDAGRMGEEAKV